MGTNILQLPQVTFSFPYQIPKHQYLLVAGGRPPAESWLTNAAGSRILWCIDHGLDCCRRAGLLPDHLFGDGDSASPESWQWASEQHVPIEKYKKDKDLTDTQLALEYISHEPDSMAILTGCFGKRADHFFSTMFTCANTAIPVCLADEQEVLYPLPEGREISISFRNTPFAISLLPLTGTCEGVTIDHVRWPLKQATLKQAFPNAVSNLPLNNKKITITIEEGILGIYL